MTAYVPVDDLDDPRLGDYRGARDPVRLRDSGVFLAEGRLCVETLVLRSPLEVRSVFATPASRLWFDARGLELDDGCPLFIAEPRVFEGVAGYRFHQGCLAAGVRPEPVDVAKLLANTGQPRRVVVLDTVSNPDNVGTIFRTSEAFGVGAIALTSRSASPLYRKSIRTSMGAALTVPFAHDGTGVEAAQALKAAGYTVLAFALAPDPTPLEDVVATGLPERLALVFGSEGYGLDRATIEHADHVVSIPIAASTDSLNVAAAAAIALYRTA